MDRMWEKAGVSPAMAFPSCLEVFFPEQAVNQSICICVTFRYFMSPLWRLIFGLFSNFIFITWAEGERKPDDMFRQWILTGVLQKGATECSQPLSWPGPPATLMWVCQGLCSFKSVFGPQYEGKAGISPWRHEQMFPNLWRGGQPEICVIFSCSLGASGFISTKADPPTHSHHPPAITSWLIHLARRHRPKKEGMLP